jgi:hypothetical protein
MPRAVPRSSLPRCFADAPRGLSSDVLWPIGQQRYARAEHRRPGQSQADRRPAGAERPDAGAEHGREHREPDLVDQACAVRYRASSPHPYDSRCPLCWRFSSRTLSATSPLIRVAFQFVLGRETYQGLARVWPTITDDRGFADRVNALPKFVASRTLTEPLEGSGEGDLEPHPAPVRDEIDSRLRVQMATCQATWRSIRLIRA